MASLRCVFVHFFLRKLRLARGSETNGTSNREQYLLKAYVKRILYTASLSVHAAGKVVVEGIL